MRYLLAITLPKNLSLRLAKIQQRYRSKRWSIALPPHITLLPPAKIKSDLQELGKILAKIAAQFSPFEIKIPGVGKFRNRGNTIFAKIEKNQSLADLQESLSRQSGKHLAIENNHQHFRPHITLSNQLEQNEAQEKLANIQKLIPKAKFLCEKITLFSKPDNAQKYQKLADFVFASTKD